MSTFNYLSGTVRIKANGPEEWLGKDDLPFWQDPNNEHWGNTLCRVLFHETIHFWQILSSGYLANLVAAEWLRLLEYEKIEQLPPTSTYVHQHVSYQKNIPFSNRELVETWARYWDVHTRSPARIMQEEKLGTGSNGPWEINSPGSPSGSIAYTNNAFDAVMQTGPDCKVYGRPYQWLLQRFEGKSAFVALLFPIIAHAAFGSPNPVLVFTASFDRAWKEKAISDRMNERSGSINLDWFRLWPAVLKEAVIPVLQENQFPVYTSGLDVIERGPLQTHPIFREYVHKVMVKGFLQLYRPVPRGSGQLDLLEAQALSEAPLTDQMIPFAFPGQPFYRLMLGQMTPPPAIKFDNFTWWARRPAVLKLMAAQKGAAFSDTFMQLSSDLERRVLRFRAAEKAVSLGLPANSFETKAMGSRFQKPWSG